jgi:ribonuclease D
MFAYREQVCLIQISIPSQDYIIDPLVGLELSGLGVLMADPAIEKVFHAAEYDLILLKREYGWKLNHLFDTMWAARILGYSAYGLASLLEKLYQVKLDKRFQKSNWCNRPLTPAQLNYARLDTHYLLQLRDHLAAEIQAAGREEEAQEIFTEQTRVKLSNNEFDPESFWSINGVYDLNRQEQAILKALSIYRDREARRRNTPLFKILSDRTLLEVAQSGPTNFTQLRHIHGMTPGQLRRYGKQLLDIVAAGKQAPPPPFPKRNKRAPDDVVGRYDKLHTWRKIRAQARGVESDVIMSRGVLWTIAEMKPETMEDLAEIETLGEWRRQTYGQEILRVLRE